ATIRLPIAPVAPATNTRISSSFSVVTRSQGGRDSSATRDTVTVGRGISSLVAMETHDELRGYLFAIAYRMLGSVAEAEDVVQEAYLRYHGSERDSASQRAYLATVTTRIAIDQLRSARARREVYPGEWLPQPLVGADAARHDTPGGAA